MTSDAKAFTYVVKHPGKRAEPVTPAKGVKFWDEIYRVIESADGNPPGRNGSMGDRPYPEQFKKPHLRVIFDDELLLKPMKPNRWGIKGPIIVARLKDDHYSSLNPEETEGVIEDLEREPRKNPNDWEQQLKDRHSSLLYRLGKRGCMVPCREAVSLVFGGSQRLSSEGPLGGSPWDGSVKGPHPQCPNETANLPFI